MTIALLISKKYRSSLAQSIIYEIYYSYQLIISNDFSLKYGYLTRLLLF